jgi:hypothetical protein
MREGWKERMDGEYVQSTSYSCMTIAYWYAFQLLLKGEMGTGYITGVELNESTLYAWEYHNESFV